METKTALILDDDLRLNRLAAKILERRGFDVVTTSDPVAALAIAAQRNVSIAVIEGRVSRMTFLEFVEKLRTTMPEGRIIVHTHYGSIAGAVFALQAGAAAYVEKSSGIAALEAAIDDKPLKRDIPEDPMTGSRMKWEHIHRVWIACGENVSETARRLGMHRRSLQRMLGKRSPA